MEPSALLLLVAFRHKIEEPDLDSGLSRVATIAGQGVDPNAFYPVLAEALSNGYIRDPIQLRPGALQCRWCLELTPNGFGQVLEILRKSGETADELLASAAFT